MPFVPLMPLVLSSGWAIIFNSFYDLTITTDNSDWFDEDLLWLTRVRIGAEGIQRQVGDIDVGWYPSSALDGTYRLYLLGRDGWDEILIDIVSRDRHIIAHAITICSEAPLENQQSARDFFANRWHERVGTPPPFTSTT